MKATANPLGRAVLSDGAPFVACFALMFVPYLLFVPIPLIPLQLAIPKIAHVGICSALIAALGFSAFIGWRSGRRTLIIPRQVQFTPAYVAALWFLVGAAIAAHLLVLATSGSSYLRGGFVAARQDLIFQGVGVLLRLYIPALPLLGVATGNSRKFQLAIGVLALLVVARVIVLSERLAFIEYLITLWAVAKVLRLKILDAHVILVGGVVAALFMGALVLRTVQSRDANFRDTSGGFAASSTVAYYADTQNKLYYFAMNGIRSAPLNVLLPVRALVSDKNQSVMMGRIYMSGMSKHTRSIVAWLNNPGGMAQWVQDFGPLFGTLAACLGFALAGFVIARMPALGISVLLAPLIAIQVADFPRENWLLLPFASYVACVAIVLWLMQMPLVLRILPSRRSLRPALNRGIPL